EIEIGDDGIHCEVAGNGPGDVVGDGGRAGAALRTHDRDDPPDRLGFGSGKQVADRTHHVDGGDGGNHIIADAAAHQLAIQGDVVDAADHDDPRAGVADGCELVEAGENVGAPVGLQHDNVGCRRRAI